VWVKFDDQTPEDPEIEDLSDGAFRLWFAAICYSQRQLTDGYVPARKLPKLVPNFRRSQVDELTRPPEEPGKPAIFTARAGGFQVRQFEKWNRTAEYWRKQAESAAARKERWKERRSGQEDDN